MRVALVACLAVLAASGSARAADELGVVVTGDATFQPKVNVHVQGWLQKHGHGLLDAPLSPDAVNTLANCLVIDDQKCARAVFDARSSASSLIVVDVAVKAKHFVFRGYWFVKGTDPIAVKRSCPKCSADQWPDTVDELLAALTRSTHAVMGRIHVASEPPGIAVVLDRVEVGVTPLVRDVPAGSHHVDLVHQGRNVGARDVDVDAGDAVEVSIKTDVVIDKTSPSNLGPWLLIGGGGGLAATGAVFLYFGSIGGPDEKHIYPGSTQAGVGFVVVGLGAAVGGAIWMMQNRESRSMPVAAIAPGAGYVGWVTRF